MVSKRFLNFYKGLCLTTLFLIALGGSVRAMNAGLACPDWPLCFGDVIPDYHPQVYFEFLHRVLAGLVAIAVFIANTILIRKKEVSPTIKKLCWGTFFLLVAQIIMGGLTVTLQLHAKVVTLHLALGTGLYACLHWILFSISPNESYQKAQVPQNYRKFSLVALGVIYTQILLGGLVASHYAALVCIDFPMCHGEFIPTFKGILGLQVIHRLGAYVTTLVVLGLFIMAIKTISDSLVRRWAWALLVLILIQVGVGIANVLLLTPPLITVMHLFFGTVLLGVILKINHINSIAKI